MTRALVRNLLLIASFTLSACGGNPEEELPGHLGKASSALVNDNALNANALNANALNANALNANALNANALNANALNANALNANALSAAALTAIQNPGSTGDLSRELLKYVVSCALDATQSFDFSWTDSQSVVHQESYPGFIGVATKWSSKKLNKPDEERVSACLASRVNWYGVTVIISSRDSSGPLGQPSANETTLYSVNEGAFFGDVFLTPPQLYACHVPANDANSRSQLRDCAAGHLVDGGPPEDCGIVHVVGTCASACNFNAPHGYYSSCTDSNGSKWSSVVTTYLQ